MIRSFFFWFLLSLAPLALFAQAEAPNGKAIFTQRCAACHSFTRQIVGPGLQSITKRRTAAWLTRYIRDSQAMVKAGDPAAVSLFAAYDRQVMPPNTDMTAPEMQALLAYLAEK
jgi:cytochrome c2